jgi:hypothetical protein
MNPHALPLAFLALAALPAAAQVCQAQAGARPPVVLELYTSEGCSSCPPADRWLSSLRAGAEVLPLSFHVSYWNRLGWPDRFASKEATQRQHDWARALGSSNVYTPQVVAGGRDWRRWPALPEAPAAAPMQLTLKREGKRMTAEVGAAPGQWQAYWAVLEDGHRSRVTAGENNGETLAHDHVVRHLQPVPAWGAAAQRFELQIPPPEAGRPQRVAFVVENAATRRPVQALACR